MKHVVDRLHADLDALRVKVGKQFEHEWQEHDELYELVAALAQRVDELERELAELKRSGQSRAVGEPASALLSTKRRS